MWRLVVVALVTAMLDAALDALPDVAQPSAVLVAALDALPDVPPANVDNAAMDVQQQPVDAALDLLPNRRRERTGRSRAQQAAHAREVRVSRQKAKSKTLEHQAYEGFARAWNVCHGFTPR